MFLFGGPSQLETFDLKPDAPEKIRGPFRPIASPHAGPADQRAPAPARRGLRQVLRRADDDAPVQRPQRRGALHPDRQDVARARSAAASTPRPATGPSMGSVVEYLTQHQPGGIGTRPARLRRAAQLAGPPPGGRASISARASTPAGSAARYNPLTTVVDKKDLKDNPYWRDCSDEELTFQIEGLAPGEGLRLDRMNRRRLAPGSVRRPAPRRWTASSASASSTAFASGPWRWSRRRATREALDIRREPARLRDRYGRHLFGQSALVARRLVEAGVRFVTVHYDACDGYGWDSHVHSDDVKNHLMPTFDQGPGGAPDRPGRARPAGRDAGRRPRRDGPDAAGHAAMGPRPLEHALPRRPGRRRHPRRHRLRPLRQGRRPPRRPSRSAPRAWPPRSTTPSASRPSCACPTRRGGRRRSCREGSRFLGLLS